MYTYTNPISNQILSKTIYMWWLVSVWNVNSNQVIFDWVCNVCWILRNNLFQKSNLSIFKSNLKVKKNYLKNMFDNILDPTKFTIRKINLTNTTKWKELIINNYIDYQKPNWKDTFNWNPHVEVLLVNADKNNHVLITTQNEDNEIKYDWKKTIYVIWYWMENWKIVRKPVDVIINTNIIPKDIWNLQTWKKIKQELAIITDWDIIIWPNSTFINAILMAKWNMLILPSNSPFRLYWWLIVSWKILNYKRKNTYDMNYSNPFKNFQDLAKNFALIRLRYPVSLLLDKRFLNSKLFSYIYKISWR